MADLSRRTLGDSFGPSERRGSPEPVWPALYSTPGSLYERGDEGRCFAFLRPSERCRNETADGTMLCAHHLVTCA